MWTLYHIMMPNMALTLRYLKSSQERLPVLKRHTPSETSAFPKDGFSPSHPSGRRNVASLL